MQGICTHFWEEARREIFCTHRWINICWNWLLRRFSLINGDSENTSVSNDVTFVRTGTEVSNKEKNYEGFVLFEIPELESDSSEMNPSYETYQTTNAEKSYDEDHGHVSENNLLEEPVVEQKALKPDQSNERTRSTGKTFWVRWKFTSVYDVHQKISAGEPPAAMVLILPW